MQKYGNRTQSLVNNPEGCLNDKAPVHEVSMVSISQLKLLMNAYLKRNSITLRIIYQLLLQTIVPL